MQKKIFYPLFSIPNQRKPGYTDILLPTIGNFAIVLKPILIKLFLLCIYLQSVFIHSAKYFFEKFAIVGKQSLLFMNELSYFHVIMSSKVTAAVFASCLI